MPSTGRRPPTPRRPAWRAALERRSAPALLYLTQLPRAVPFAVVGLLLLVGVAVGGPVGFAALLAVAAVMAWLLAVGWPAMSGGGRVLRLLATLAVVAAAVAQLFH